MIDIRRILIIFVVGVLFSVFVFTSIEAAYPGPDYEDYCGREYYAPKRLVDRDKVNCPDVVSQTELDSCADKEGSPKYKYDENSCVSSWECSMCEKNYRSARENHNFWSFLIATIMGLIGVAISLYLPMKKGSVHEWVGSGLMLGGLISIFIGTMMYFGDLHRVVRPFVILIELVLVIALAYKKLDPKKK